MKKLSLSLLLSLASLLLTLTAIFWVSPVQADSFNIGCTNGVGDVADLIAKINTANSNGSGEDILILGANCVYTLTAANNYWYGPTGLPAITSTVTIAGNGAVLVRGVITPFRFFYKKLATPRAQGGFLPDSHVIKEGGMVYHQDAAGRKRLVRFLREQEFITWACGRYVRPEERGEL